MILAIGGADGPASPIIGVDFKRLLGQDEVRQGAGWLVDLYKHDFQWIDGNAGILDVHDSSFHALSAKVFIEAHFQAARITNSL